ncbi:hypothetical protein G7Y89_g12132 [Cudoniella acicularis]|uniref:Uncharacterized protein n=1 Tax=Cudoniella acicularis TaxID=354080 RepID=A0A8H4RCE8_9HELO|nr:hypothetical protein G7Y89_g12132 [Cudoniella acicularis]
MLSSRSWGCGLFSDLGVVASNGSNVIPVSNEWFHGNYSEFPSFTVQQNTSILLVATISPSIPTSTPMQTTISYQQPFSRKSTSTKTTILPQNPIPHQPTITPALPHPPRVEDGGLEIIIEKSSTPNSLTDWTLDWKGASQLVKGGKEMLITSEDKGVMWNSKV